MAAVKFVRSRWFLVTLGVLAVVVVALAILALPLRHVPGRAADAQAELTSAAEAMKANDMEVGFEHVHAARAHVDSLTDVTDGVGAKVWSWVPVAGGAVRDVRNMATAVDQVTSALEVAEKVYPQVTGDDATLLEDGNVDLPTLDKLVDAVHEIDRHVTTARSHLEDVNGTAPFVGDMVSEKRDTALEQVGPASEALEKAGPLVDVLPDMLGEGGEKRYLIAMMNPAEVKYSGGSMLTFSVLKVKDGELKRKGTIDAANDTQLFRRGWWENVEGNVFASPWSERITHANMAPSWPIAGEETLRAWDYFRKPKDDMDGLIALDVVAISRMLEATGPLEVEGLGQVTAENVVERTTGEYTKFTLAQQAERKELNRALVPAFMERLFSGADFVGTVQAIVQAADERHFALYFRDADTQAAAADVGFSGDLSDTDNDYVGVFTQNLVGSKADYWQRKDVRSKVTLNEDGSARVKLTAKIRNMGPTEVNFELSGYTDPTINAYVAAFLPKGAKVDKVRIRDSNGKRTGMTGTDTSDEGEYFGRPYVRETVELRAGDEAALELTYDVPHAAVVEDGKMTYRFDLDPHPTVQPARTRVTVVWPEGWAPTNLPEGWTTTDEGTSRWENSTTVHYERLRVTARRAS